MTKDDAAEAAALVRQPTVAQVEELRAMARPSLTESVTPRLPMVRATFRVPPLLWLEAQRKAEERGDVLSEEIRKFLQRYVRSTK